MNAFPVSFRFIATALLSLVLIVIGVANLRARIQWTYPTDGVFWTESEGILTAEAIDPNSPGDQAGIHLDDQLLSINDHTISNLGQYNDWIYQTKPGASAHYKLAGSDGIRSITIQLGSKDLFSAKDGIKILLAFLHLGVGIFVLFRCDWVPRTFHFYLLSLAAFVVWFFSYTPALRALDWWVYGLSASAFLLLPALFVHFCLRFPIDAIAERNRVFLLYIPVILLGVFHLLWITGHLAPLGLPLTARSSNILDRIELAFFFIGFIVGGVMLLKRRIESREILVLQQLKWISYGTLAGFLPFSLIYIIPTLLGARESFAMDASMLFLGFIPLSMGYALVRYRLFDVEVIVRRGAAYFISSALLLAVYLLFVLVLSRVLQWIAPQANFMAICLAALVIALLFAPLRNAVQLRLDRLFYRDQFEDRATLLDFARTLGSEISLAPLSRSILERIVKTFQIDKAAIFLSNPAHAGVFRLADSLYSDALSADHLYPRDELIDRDSPGNPIGLKSGAIPLYRTSPVLMKSGFLSLQDLRLHGKQVGMIALGQLPEGRYFSSEDLDLLSALAGYAAMALENANLYNSVETKALELERLNIYTENILESINVAVLALDPGGQITSCNKAFEALYDTNRKQIAGFPIESLLPTDVLASIQRITGTKTWRLESPANIFKLYLENRSSKHLIVNLSLIPLLNAMAENAGSLIVLDDITEKVQMEDQLMQAEKLSSIGLLAAGIAHEVNTPIAGISSYTQMLLKETPESDRNVPILKKIEKQTFRAAEIVNGLLNFSRLNNSEFASLNINQLINDSLALLDHQLQINRIKVESQYDDSLPPIYGNTGKLQQVFINLFLNARDAMPSGGELAVQTGMIDSAVVVDITDTGIGIPEENLRKIFDPFFTTKAIGKGTGLGLSVTYGIIQEHGGRIFVDSSSGRGTHFRLKLPTRPN